MEMVELENDQNQGAPAEKMHRHHHKHRKTENELVAWQYKRFKRKINGSVFKCMHRKLTQIFTQVFTYPEFSNIQQVNLYDNRLAEIPADIFQHMPLLKAIVLSKNKLRLINAYTFSNLQFLAYIVLFDNQLEFIAENAFSNLPALKWIDLSENPLQSVLADALNVTRFTEIYFFENPLNEDVKKALRSKFGYKVFFNVDGY